MCGYLADLADQGRRIGTVHVARSALSTWFAIEQQHPDAATPNPAQSPVVARMLKGIANEQEARRAQRPMAQLDAEETFALQLSTLQLYRFSASDPLARMYRAAAYLGVGAALRPSELLGSSAHPGRALRMEQLAFFSDLDGRTRVHPPSRILPLVLTLTLRETKTTGTLRKHVVLPAVLEAVWPWFSECSARDPSAVLFQCSGRPPATTYGLVEYLKRRHEDAGLPPARITGKSLRRGGASTLAAHGAGAGDIARLGWADGSSTWQRYASEPAVQRARAVRLAAQVTADLQARPA